MNIHGLYDQEEEEEIRSRMASPRAYLAFSTLEVARALRRMVRLLVQVFTRRLPGRTAATRRPKEALRGTDLTRPTLGPTTNECAAGVFVGIRERGSN